MFYDNDGDGDDDNNDDNDEGDGDDENENVNNINKSKIKVMSCYTVMLYIYLVYTKPVDSVFRALWLATQSVNILHYSLIHLHFLRACDAKTRVSCEQNAFPTAVVTNKEISQIIMQAVPEIHEEGDEVRFGNFNG